PSRRAANPSDIQVHCPHRKLQEAAQPRVPLQARCPGHRRKYRALHRRRGKLSAELMEEFSIAARSPLGYIPGGIGRLQNSLMSFRDRPPGGYNSLLIVATQRRATLVK